MVLEGMQCEVLFGVYVLYCWHTGFYSNKKAFLGGEGGDSHILCHLHLVIQ